MGKLRIREGIELERREIEYRTARAVEKLKLDGSDAFVIRFLYGKPLTKKNEIWKAYQDWATWGARKSSFDWTIKKLKKHRLITSRPYGKKGYYEITRRGEIAQDRVLCYIY